MAVQINFTGFEQQLLFNQKPFFAKIYEGEGDPPEGFNIVHISLDATERSLLNWKEAICSAQRAIERGFLVLWELQFALLDGSLEDETRFLTFQLNVQHFNEIIWPNFKEHTFGIALFRGAVREGVVNYLKSLAAILAEGATCFLFLDTNMARDLAAYFQLVNQESFGSLRLFLKGPFPKQYPWAVPAFAWGHGFSPLGFCADALESPLPQKDLKYALCLPEKPNWHHVQQVVNAFGPIPFRVIPENLLTQEWDGIDTCIIFPEELTEKSWRKVRGFIAAGGEIIKFPDVQPKWH